MSTSGNGLEPRDLIDALWLVQLFSSGQPEPVAPAPLWLEETGPDTFVSSASSAEPTDQHKSDAPADSSDGTLVHPVGALFDDGIPVRKVPVLTVPALPRRNEIARALRPLKQHVAAPGSSTIDEERSADASAEARRVVPVTKSTAERWLELALVIDDSSTMGMWRRTTDELRRLMERHGAFRNVRTWRMRKGQRGQLLLHDVFGQPHEPAELHDHARRRLILLVTDGVDSLWRTAESAAILHGWAAHNPIAVVQVLPNQMWHRTCLPPVSIEVRRTRPGMLAPGPAPYRLRFGERPSALWIPLVGLGQASLMPWAELLAGQHVGPIDCHALPVGCLPFAAAPEEPIDLSARERVARFQVVASPTAFQLAGYLAGAPLSVPVMQAIQQAVLPDSEPGHLAEVMLSGLIERTSMASAEEDPDLIVYDFLPDVREELLRTRTRQDMYTVLDSLVAASPFVANQFGTIDAYTLAGDPAGHLARQAGSRAFAEVAVTVLGGLGRVHAEMADRIDAVLRAGTAEQGSTGRSGMHLVVTGHPWPRLSQVDVEADDGEVLAAARYDLVDEFRNAIREVDPALSIDEAGVIVGPGAYPNLVVPDLVVPVVGPSGHRREVRLSRTVISRARDRSVDPVTLVACALASPNDLDATWRPKRVGLAEAPPRDLLNVYTELFRLTESVREVEQALDTGNDVLLIGKHGSGKTAIAGHFAETYLLGGEGVVWLDLSDPAEGPESILATLLRTARHKRYLLVVDGIHANLPVVDGILVCVLRLRAEFGIVVQVLATGWRTAALRLPEAFKDIRMIRVRGEDLIDQLVGALSAPDAAAIRALAGGDVHLAATALTFYREYGRVPTRRNLQEALTKDVVDPKVQHAMYWLACLCFFEIDVSINLTRGKFADEADWLLAHGVIRASDSSYTMGPWARAALLLRHALDEWDAEAQWGRPAELTWLYLHRHGERAIRALLTRLDLGGGTDVREPTRYLLSAWEMQGRLERHLESLCAEDPQWGDQVGAASFAAMALAASERTDAWRQVARYLRGRWRYRWAYELPTPEDGPTADFADFAAIREHMARQDNLLGDAPHLAGMHADQVDLDRFYRTWVLGLLLGVEGTAPASEQRPERIARLVEIARQVQHPSGYFYPQRATWITARMVLGLCQAGESYETSVTVQRACNWLLRPVLEDGAFDLWWRSGTGAWNSDEAVTAICLTALFRAGVRENRAIDSALTWLIGQERRWTRPGRDIDLAHVLEVMLLAPSRPPGAYQHVEELLVRTLRALNEPVTEAGLDIPEESYRMPFATFQLASLVWTMVNREFTKLLDDVINAESAQRRLTAPVSAAPESSPAAPTPQVAPSRLTEQQLTAWRSAADQLLNRIHHELDERVGLPGPATQRRFDEYRAHRVAAERLAAELRRDTPDETLAELDRLGRSVVGVAWPYLPRPGTPDM